MSITKTDQPNEQPKNPVQQAAKGATTSAPRRTYRTIIFQGSLIALTSAFTLLMVLAKSTPFFPIDLQITRGIQLINNPGFSGLMSFISWPGYPPQSFVIPVFLVAMIWGLGFRWEAMAALVAAVTSAGIDVLVKDYIQRPRPTSSLVHVFRILNSYSFPSGHVMFYVVFFGFLLFLAFALLKNSLNRTLLIAFLAALILLVGPSRIYVGEHWASDVAGAYLLGYITLIANIAFYRWGKQRFFVTQPVETKETPVPPKTKPAA